MSARGAARVVLLVAILAVALIAAAILARIGRGEPLRAATFNIERFPKGDGQASGAFDLLKALEVDVVGVQEITNPEVFAREARARLGPSWRFVAAERSPPMRVGVLFDAARFDLVSTRTYDAIRTSERDRPAFEARLTRAGRPGPTLRVIVVHLKATSEGLDIRRRQHRALAPILRAAADSGDEVLLLGDFNATEIEDRQMLQELAVGAGLSWVSKGLDCTAYWSRDDGCLGSRLDHVIAWDRRARVKARGPCEEEGCATKDRCPVFTERVSDHCPVTVDLRF